MRYSLSGIVLAAAVLTLVTSDAFAHSGGTNDALAHSGGTNDAFAHSGGTNAAGCHTNRRTGDYHCHRPRTQSFGRTNYCHVVRGQNRCGYALRTCNTLVNRFGGYCVRQQQ